MYKLMGMDDKPRLPGILVQCIRKQKSPPVTVDFPIEPDQVGGSIYTVDDYSGCIASTGQTSAHEPQSVHTSGSIT